MNKYQIYPWIPIIGILLILLNIEKAIEKGSFTNAGVYYGSALYQALCLTFLLIYFIL